MTSNFAGERSFRAGEWPADGTVRLAGLQQNNSTAPQPPPAPFFPQPAENTWQILFPSLPIIIPVWRTMVPEIRKQRSEQSKETTRAENAPKSFRWRILRDKPFGIKDLAEVIEVQVIENKSFNHRTGRGGMG
ncbi:MAG: hypothetical protein ACLQHT_08975 [Terracidiphilus sp.]